MNDKARKDERDPKSKVEEAGVAGEEATGQIPPTPAENRSAESARNESGEGPTRGVTDDKKGARE